MIDVVPDRPNKAERDSVISAMDRELQNARYEASRSDDAFRRAWWIEVERDFVLSPEHIKLLKRMRFELVERADIASVAASGKRPFGNSDWVGDVFDALRWTPEYDEDGLTEACVNRACRIMAELPLALNQILAELDIT